MADFLKAFARTWATREPVSVAGPPGRCRSLYRTLCDRYGTGSGSSRHKAARFCERNKLRGLSAVWLALSAVAFANGPNLPAQTASPGEYQVKAVFLFNFAQFVEWPAQAFAEPRTPLIIGVLGEDPFGAYLDDTVRDERVKNRPLAVQRYRRVDEIKSCHILFISRSETNRLDQIFAGLKGRSILTVSDADGFAQHGGMIRFITESNKIRFRISLDAAKAANLTISSKLLRAAEIVNRGSE